MENTNWEIIAKYISGEASDEEIQIAENIINSSPEVLKEYNNIKKFWDESENFQDPYELDIDAAWNKINKSLDGPAQNQEVKEINSGKKNGTGLSIIWKIAAGFVILAASYFAFQTLTAPNEKPEIAAISIKTTKADRQSVALEDGTKIWINSESELSYPEKFEGNERMVTLTGEAFFNVQSNPEKPFVIKTNSGIIKVLGTQFNIKEYPDENELEVLVSEGKVSVSILDKESKTSEVILTKGEKAIFSKSDKQLRKETQADITYNEWKEGNLVFNGENLDRVIQRLERWYNVKFELSNPQLKKCQLIANFNDSNIDEVLTVIEEALNVQSEKKEYIYILSGEGCQ